MDPAKTTGAAALIERSNLMTRVASSLVLAPLTVAVAYWGGAALAAFWTVVAFCVLWEWDTLVCAHEKKPVLTIGSVAIAGAAALLTLGRVGAALALIVLGALGVAALASRVERLWCVGGVLYAGGMVSALLLLRSDAALGFAALVFLFAVVWLTDIVAYFCGRALGGPKLMPYVSPNKTWSGAIGGAAGGIFGGVAVALYAGIDNAVAMAVLALFLSAAAQAGDLLESAIKRRFDVKDASGLIPGHGGVMDRVDGLVIAVIVAALIGAIRGGLESPAHGLLVW